ncbi:MAG: 1-(5-phosphoribosyl)-5-amino-4-imidazole-carboxylate carboxylase, partial [Planctomycetota bacterium]
MDRSKHEIESLAHDLLAGKLAVEGFVEALGAPGTANLGDVTLDLDRSRRCGFPEVVFGEGKPAETLVRIVRQLYDSQVPILVTRVDAPKAERLLSAFPTARYNAVGKVFCFVPEGSEVPHAGQVTVVTAGTSDIPVAEEARETAAWMGTEVTMIHDVGVAGPHRLPVHIDKLRPADAVVVVAGLEGALPSVVGGYVD